MTAGGIDLLWAVVALWVSLTSAAAAVFVWVDSSKALAGRRQIRERTLAWVATIGGAPGIILGMEIFQDWSPKDSFIDRIYLISVVWVLVLLVLRA
jgi:uncharacterized membrane protein YsdA (DUF1294 family)